MKIKQLTIFSLLTVLLILTSCSESPTNETVPDQPDDSEPPTLSAVIGYSPASPEVGMDVNLDATASSDDQNIGYDVSWSFTDRPAGSSAAISGSTQQNAVFTPDVAGDYIVELEISNSTENVSDSQTATITVTPVEQNTIELSGTINSDSTLVDLLQIQQSLITL